MPRALVLVLRQFEVGIRTRIELHVYSDGYPDVADHHGTGYSGIKLLS